MGARVTGTESLSMADFKIIALEGDEDRAAALRDVFSQTDKYELFVSKSPKKLADLMDGSDRVAAVITNTEISNDVNDGLKFIFLKSLLSRCLLKFFS